MLEGTIFKFRPKMSNQSGPQQVSIKNGEVGREVVKMEKEVGQDVGKDME